MPKKKEEEGAPAYMAMFTTLMILLLAFFIVINSMSTTKSTPFNEGIGQVQDAFGISGGFGLMRFTTFRSMVKRDGGVETAKDPESIVGTKKKHVEGLGGVGSTDLDYEPKPKNEYVRISVPYRFEKGSAVIPADLANYLEVAGMGFAMFNTEFTIRTVTTEGSTSQVNRELSTKRAVAIMRYMHRACGINYEKMASAGYNNNRYFEVADEEKNTDRNKQQTYFYIFRKIKDEES